MWLTHFWHSWSQFFIFAWDVTGGGGILRTGVLICLVTACLIGKNTGTIFVMCNLWWPKIVPTNKYHILSASFVKKIGPNIYHIFWKHKRLALWGPSDAIWHHWSLSSSFQVMAWCQTGPKPLPEPIINTKERNFCEIEIEVPTSFFSCDQAALQMVFSVRPSVRLSVCPSVCHTFLTMFPSSYHHEIFRSYYQWPK